MGLKADPEFETVFRYKELRKALDALIVGEED